MPEVVHISALILLLIFMFAIIGMNLLGRVALQGCLTEQRNFQSVPTAMLTLLGMATADEYTCMMHACAIEESSGHCSEERGDCGLPIGSRFYFFVFACTVVFTTVQMFVNVIISNYMALAELVGLALDVRVILTPHYIFH